MSCRTGICRARRGSPRSLFLLRRNRQTKHRELALPSDVQADFIRIGQIQRLAMFTAINFGVFAPRLLHVAAVLFFDIAGVKPALQVTAAELAFGVFFVAGALSG